jgi:hypothetical protein
VNGANVRGGAAASALEELTGLHGAFVFPERLLQQIWLRGEFDAQGLRLCDGRPVRLLRRGRWNRLPGPDFREAEIVVGEGALAEIVRGDVEVHLRAADWEAHAHARDGAYDRVVLHVVLFPVSRPWTEGGGGRRIPILELLPLLDRDLEAYAEEAAIEQLAGRPFSQLRSALAAMPAEALSAEVERHAARRWGNKLALARRRIEAAGWEEACHQAALEVLGYRPNRAPMLSIAERRPIAAWRAGDYSVEALYIEEEGNWVRAGVRPANQPRRRLAQYAEWVRARPDWPERLARVGAEAAASAAQENGVEAAAGGDGSAGRKSRTRRLRSLRKRLAEEVTDAGIGGTRFDTLVCDSWFPLLAARAAMEGDGQGVSRMEGFWRDWSPGDAPAELVRLAREFGAGGCGSGRAGWSQGGLQGLLGWLALLLARSGRGT